MRALSSTVETNIVKRITAPTWLLKLHYPTPILLTSGRVITFEDMTFTRQGLRVAKVTESKIQFTLRDNDNAIKAAIDVDGIDDIYISLWKYYETDGTSIWTGFIDGVRYRNHEAEFSGSRVRQGSATFPNRFYSRADFPYLPNDGTVLKWNGIELTLRSR